MTKSVLKFRNIMKTPEKERRLPIFSGNIPGSVLNVHKLFLYVVVKTLFQCQRFYAKRVDLANMINKITRHFPIRPA
jgi:hypothetical protein